MGVVSPRKIGNYSGARLLSPLHICQGHTNQLKVGKTMLGVGRRIGEVVDDRSGKFEKPSNKRWCAKQRQK
jgi:hypothetical protein